MAAAALLHLPLSDAIMWGVLISIPSVFAAGLYCLTLKEPVAPQEEYIKSAEASKDKKLPSVGTSLAPIIPPLVLIFLNTGINAMFPDTTVAKVFVRRLAARRAPRGLPVLAGVSPAPNGAPRRS